MQPDFDLLDLLREQRLFGSEHLTMAERFERYHAANPGVYAAMCSLAREWRARTGRQIGINSLVERVRWEVALRTNDPDFKINNSYAPFYSRLLMLTEPDLADAFTTRKSAADSWAPRRICTPQILHPADPAPRRAK